MKAPNFFFEPHNNIILIFLMIVQKIFYQFLRFKKLLRFGLSMGIF